MAKPESTIERFLKYVSPEPNSGCWLWSGFAKDRDYGRFWLDGAPQQAHRVAYQIWRGAIADGLSIDHLCRVHCCVNPAHLEAVPQGENMRRGEVFKNAAKRQSAKKYCPLGHEYTPENTYQRNSQKPGRECRACRRDRLKRYFRNKAQKICFD